MPISRKLCIKLIIIYFASLSIAARNDDYFAKSPASCGPSARARARQCASASKLKHDLPSFSVDVITLRLLDIIHTCLTEQFGKRTRGTRTRLTIDLVRRVSRNDVYSFRIDFEAATARCARATQLVPLVYLIGAFLARERVFVPRSVGESPIKLKIAKLIAVQLYYYSSILLPVFVSVYFVNSTLPIQIKKKKTPCKYN